MTRILVTGATGSVGHALVEQLAARGATVRALSRHAEHADLPAGVEPYACDLGDPAGLQDALRDVDRAFLLTGGPEGPRHDAIFAEAAARAGLEAVVKLSVLGITEGADDLISRWHREGEQALLASGVPATFVRPGAFMSNALNWAASIAASGRVFSVLGDLPVACIDPIDVAAVAYELLTHPRAAGTGFPVTGPDAPTPRQQVEILAEIVGRPIELIDITPDQARGVMVEHGMPELLADGVIGSMIGPLHGFGQTPTATVEEITGLPPRDFRTWALAHTAALTTPPREW